MITRLRAENFKSWKDTGELRLAPLTGLFGANSSGKTSILQILLMLKQTVDSSDPNQVLNLGGDDKWPVDLRTFPDLIFSHSAEASLGVSVSFRSPHVGTPIRFDISIKEDNQRLVVSEFTYSIDDVKEGMSARGDGQYDFFRNGERQGPFPPPVKCYDYPIASGSPVTWYFRHSTAPTDLEFAVSAVRHLGPLRVHPSRSYSWAGTEPVDVGRDGREAAQALFARRGKTRDVEWQVARWLKLMKLVDSFHVVPIAPNRRDFEVRVKQSSRSPEVLLTDVGFGVSQILPVLVLCYYVPGGSTVILEQPETHLHPSVQADLADVLVEVVKLRGLQIIVESHSEHLLRRLQRRVAEGELSTEDTALYFCEIKNGKSKARELEIGDDGFIKNWPKDFFGDEMAEVAALTEAAMKQRIRKVK